MIDPGIGIAAEDLPRLFNAFEQGNPEITRSFGGLGLGLAISKALVDQHGGTLTGVSPGRGKGACFTVGLATVAAARRRRAGGARRRSGRGAGAPPAAGGGQRADVAR